MNDPDFLVESRRLCADLQERLPHLHTSSTEAAFKTPEDDFVTVKIPTKLAAVSGSLAWRAHDFATLACDLFDRKRIVPGAVIVRSLMETVALFHMVHKKSRNAVAERSLDTLDNFLIRCMSGNRLANGELDSPNVLTAIQSLEKEPGCDRYIDFYSSLCEFAHPNALGSFYAYSSFDNNSRVLWFGRNRGLTKESDLAFAIVFALEVFLEIDIGVKELMPSIVQLAKEVYSSGRAG